MPFEKLLSLLSRINWKAVAVLAIAVALLSLYAKFFAVALLLAGVVFISIIVNYFHLRIIGLELVTFATVIIGIVYGPLVGAVLGSTLVLIHLVLSGYFGVYYVWVIPGYAVAGWVASGWYNQDIVGLGMTLTILLHAVNVFFSFFFRREDLFKYAIYVATNLVFNFVVFTLFGAWALNVLR